MQTPVSVSLRSLHGFSPSLRGNAFPKEGPVSIEHVSFSSEENHMGRSQG